MKEDILHQIGSISRALDSIANIEFKEMDLSRGQYLYLVRIKQNPGIISDHLAQILNVDRTSAFRSISKLEKQNLITKQKDDENKKIRHLYTTQLGEQLAKKIEAENAYSNQKVLSGLNKSQIQQLKEILATVEKNAKTEWQLVKNGGKRGY